MISKIISGEKSEGKFYVYGMLLEFIKTIWLDIHRITLRAEHNW